MEGWRSLQDERLGAGGWSKAKDLKKATPESFPQRRAFLAFERITLDKEVGRNQPGFWEGRSLL